MTTLFWLQDFLFHQLLKLKGECPMWVITVFEQQDVRTFEYTNKGEATEALQKLNENAILSYIM